jgi:prepilin-type N-terminal cleavage/methylation domain-containing protein
MMHRRQGFTLIELLVVIVIIGILAAMASSFFWRSKEQAFKATLQSDLRVLAAHQENYFATNFQYAANTADLAEFRESASVTVTVTFGDQTGWAAQAIHSSYVGHQCGIFMGDAPAATGAPATVAGSVGCN